jgi:hypothetical protein
MPSATDRNHPHLRLTAAIVVAGFVAILAALGGSDSANERARRAEANALAAQGYGLPRLLMALGVVSAPAELPAHVHFEAFVRTSGLRAMRGLGAGSSSGRAIARAENRSRLDAAGPDRAARLRTTVLPPPVA